MPTHDPLIASTVAGTQSRLGEGPCWHPQEQVLYWVDIEGQALRKYSPGTKEVVAYPMPERVNAVVPMAGGGLLLALHNRVCSYNTATGEIGTLARPLTDASIRLNDGKCDPCGRFWVGTMALDVRAGAAALYCVQQNLQVTLALQHLTISNGLAWSKNGDTFYFTDSPTRTVQAFDFDLAAGSIRNPRVVVRVPEQEGMPDGLDIDVNGNLWIALHGSAAVACFNPDTGEQLQRVEVEAINVTSCTFGGPNLDTLYITTAREWLPEEQLEKYPLSGSVFEVKPGVKGREVNFFRPSV
ncbi:SMP-30/gluconolactonase/LRE family protein [Pontibacter actiniarum]|uniref:SMP-30/gluconolactonase/LRE family protein n=1 Tax=Pontibacter actiniarum TaxID=323450 RepID=UPI0004142FA9|nr:SMP-30/gluconolactonase/LRE family protein [Pontibacter actiniarum]